VRNRLIEKQKLRNPRHELLFVGVFHLGVSTKKKNKNKTLSSVPESSITFFLCVAYFRRWGINYRLAGWKRRDDKGGAIGQNRVRIWGRPNPPIRRFGCIKVSDGGLKASSFSSFEATPVKHKQKALPEARFGLPTMAIGL
jgi:hypothetical protein